MVTDSQIEDRKGRGKRVPLPWGSTFVFSYFISIFIFFTIQKCLIETCTRCDTGKTEKIRKENFNAT